MLQVKEVQQRDYGRIGTEIYIKKQPSPERAKVNESKTHILNYFLLLYIVKQQKCVPGLE